MYNISFVLEEQGIIEYLKKRQIGKQYKKAVMKLINGFTTKSLNFKERKPNGSGIWSFRITKKYRALGYMEDSTFIVVEINDHQ